MIIDCLKIGYMYFFTEKNVWDKKSIMQCNQIIFSENIISVGSNEKQLQTNINVKIVLSYSVGHKTSRSDENLKMR